MKRAWKIISWVIVIGLVTATVVWAMLPQPLEVDLGVVTRGPLTIAIREDGRTRIKDRYTVSAPVAGQLSRIKLLAGDQLRAGETILSTIHPNDPDMLDARQVAMSEARVAAAQLAIDRAQARREHALVSRDLAETQFGRLKQLVEKSAASRDEFEAAEALLRTRQEELRVSSFEAEISRFELEQAQAALRYIQPNNDAPQQQIEIRSPIDGVVLRVFQESATVVTPGTALLEIGNPADLEIVIDVLSNEAVKIQPGDAVRIEQWGGDAPLEATVRLVEPAAFTKISALGVEEQRVNVVADFRSTPADATRLGHAYRIEAAIVVWDEANILQVPNSALFRHQQQWAAFVVDNQVVTLRSVEVGQRNETAAEVLSGLNEGEQVVVYPSDLVRAGVTIKPRPTAANDEN